MDGNRLIDKLRKHKIKQKQKYQYYDNLMQPAKNAKKECIHFLASLGRNHKILKWPIFILLVAFIFVYNFIYYALVNLRVREKFARGLAMFMTAVLVLTSVDLTALAIQNTEKSRQYYEVTGFEEEFSDTLEVPFGTEIEDMELPETIVANVDLYELTSDKDKEGKGAEKTPTPTPSASPTPSATPSQTPTATPTEEAAESPTPTPSDEAVESPVPTETPEGDVTPTVEPTAPEDPSAVPTQEPTPEEQTNPEQPEQGGENNPEETQPEENNQEESQPEEPASEENNSSDNGDDGEGTEETSHELPENYSEITENVEIQEMTAEETVNEDEDTSDDNDEPNAEEGSEEDGVSDGTEGEDTYEVVESTSIELAVTWKCEEYDPLVEGEYIFVPEMPEEYDGITVKCAIEQPSITVIVGEAKAIKLSTVVDGIEIVLEAEAGVFNSDVSLNAERIVDKDIEELLEERIDDANEGTENETVLDDYMAFDITVLDKNGEEVQPREVEGVDPAKAVRVTFKEIKEKLESEETEEGEQNLSVYYVDDDITTLEEMTASKSGDDVSFNPEHFSIYVCQCTHTSYATVNTWAELCKKVLGQTGDISVKLGADITETPLTGYATENGLYVDGGCNLNLNMNGYSLTGQDGLSQVILVANGGKLEIHNTTGVDAAIVANNNNYAIKVTGSGSSMSLYGATVKNDKGSGTIVLADNGATVNLNGGELYGSGTGLMVSNSSTGNLYDASIVGVKRGVNISNGYVDLKHNSSIAEYSDCGIYLNNTSTGSLTVENADIIGSSSYNTVGINCNAGSIVNLGSGISMSNSTDIKISGYESGLSTGDVPKADTLIHLNMVPSNVLSIAVGGMTLSSGPVQFTDNYVSGSESKFKSAVSTSYDVWKESNSLYVGAKADCRITAQAQNSFQNKTTAGTDVIAGTVQIGSGSVTTQAIDATKATNLSNTGSSVDTIVKYGAQVTMKATLINSDKYVFTGWKNSKGTIVSTDTTYVFTASESEVYTAVYTKKKGIITVKSADTTKGKVTG